MNRFRFFQFRSIISISGRNEFTVRPTHQPTGDRITTGLGPKPLDSLRRRREVDTPTDGVARPLDGFRRRREVDTPTDGVAKPPISVTSEPKFVKRKAASPLEAVEKASTISGLVVRLLKMRIIKNMTKNGKYARFSSLVAVGNGRGAVGVAHSKALAAADAVSKATNQATRLMEYFPRWQNRTVFHDDIVKFQATILRIRPAAPGSGRRCHPAISEICRCMGIRDISAKVHGSRHPMNVAEAFLKALRRQKTPEMVAQESGLRIVDVLKVYQEGCEELSRTLRTERYSTLDLKKQWNQ